MVEHLCVRYILDQPTIEREQFIDEITTTMALNSLRPWPAAAAEPSHLPGDAGGAA